MTFSPLARETMIEEASRVRRERYMTDFLNERTPYIRHPLEGSTISSQPVSQIPRTKSFESFAEIHARVCAEYDKDPEPRK